MSGQVAIVSDSAHAKASAHVSASNSRGSLTNLKAVLIANRAVMPDILHASR